MPKKAKADAQGNPKKRNPFAAFFQNLFGQKAKVDTTARVEDLTPDDVVVAVMGPMGSGKSTFIELATGLTGLAGHNLAAGTKDISVIKLRFPGLDLCFIDTPGLDDSENGDPRVLKMISDWIVTTRYKKEIHLAGLFYFHRISDNRMGGTCLKNQRVFEVLCGQDYKNIVLTTTMWDEMTTATDDPQAGAKRERELKSRYWRSMIDRGSTVKRFLNTRESAFELLVPVFVKVNERSIRILKAEMNDDRAFTTSTTTGRMPLLKAELMDLLGSQQKILARIQGRSKDINQLRPLVDDYHRVSVKLQRAVEEMRALKSSTTVRTPAERGAAANGVVVGHSVFVPNSRLEQPVLPGPKVEMEARERSQEVQGGRSKQGEVKRSSTRNSRDTRRRT